MKNTWNKAAIWVLMSSSVLVASCDKEDQGELKGPLPTASFTVSAVKTVGLTNEVTFTSTSTDAFLYKWDFGDGTTGTGQTITHKYQRGGTVQAQLTAAGPRGYTVSDKQDVALPEIATIVKQLLTGGSTKTWKFDNAAEAPIIVGTEGNPGQYYAGGPANGLPTCQSDDEYTFTAANVLTYDAKAGTLVAPAQSCEAPRSGTSDFTFGPATGQGYAMLELKRAGSFIGVTDVPDQTYRIIDISATKMVLRAGKPGGTVFQYKMIAK
ncbi:PKD domain-containing protein [Hymenobacter volaticus]|uniref:PKD domain-containing protein n=1 Tax=Hymenobacter volaticus TaxID=2932254 RepID=A0ABY4G239_9BACT|nr:PKD domain-containing protein [Hymenobacter volaticus]UOQ64922.1 PKD domain-containing protein [Hymenobacter volaticus]